MTKIVTVIALCIFGIFVHPFAPGFFDFLYRFIIFALITYLVYYQFITKEKEKEKETEIEPVSQNVRSEKSDVDQEQIEEEWSLIDLISGDERSAEYIKDQFEILASILYPDYGYIISRFSEETIKIFHGKNFANPDQELSGYEYKLSGLIQILDTKDEILIENNLNHEENLVTYNTYLDYQPNSFIGIPVTVGENQKLYFVFDSKNKENFNKEDNPLLAKLSSNLKYFLINRMKAYLLYNQLKEKEWLLEFAKQVNSSKTIREGIEHLSLSISQQFEATRLAISLVGTDPSAAIIKKVVGQEDDYMENKEFPLEEGLTGWIISKNKPYLINDLEKGDYFIPRYAKEEKTNFGMRSFLGVPLQIDEKVFGAVTLEHKTAHKYSPPDKNKIQQLADVFSTIFLRTLN